MVTNLFIVKCKQCIKYLSQFFDFDDIYEFINRALFVTYINLSY